MAALDGMRILDMTQYEAGTSCTQALAWLGADVVKVEAPEYGDPGRGVGRTENLDYSAYFCAWNAKQAQHRGEPAGRRRDARSSSNSCPSSTCSRKTTAPAWSRSCRITYEDLKAVHPGIIYARIKGFGTDGPYAGFRSMDMVAQAAAGAFFDHRRSRRPTDDAGPDHRRRGHRRADGHGDPRRVRAEAAHGHRPGDSRCPCRRP